MLRRTDRIAHGGEIPADRQECRLELEGNAVAQALPITKKGSSNQGAFNLKNDRVLALQATGLSAGGGIGVAPRSLRDCAPRITGRMLPPGHVPK
jgi:hypothetical protein